MSEVEQASGRVARNDPCPCGSEKKYKRCHGSPLYDVPKKEEKSSVIEWVRAISLITFFVVALFGANYNEVERPALKQVVGVLDYADYVSTRRYGSYVSLNFEGWRQSGQWSSYALRGTSAAAAIELNNKYAGKKLIAMVEPRIVEFGPTDVYELVAEDGSVIVPLDWANHSANRVKNLCFSIAGISLLIALITFKIKA